MHRRPHPLLLRSILFRGAAIAPESGVVTTFPSGTARHAWPEIRDRVGHLAASLRRAGLAPGDRVGTLLWNEHRHLELAFAVPCLGAALHPANPRLPDADLEWTIRAAKDRFVFYDGEFDERIAALRERLPSVERWIRCGDPAAASTDPPADSWEGFVGSGPDHFEWPDL
ncbi:MAG: AMP-binding protein, partial [Phycisphaerales bacterium]